MHAIEREDAWFIQDEIVHNDRSFQWGALSGYEHDLTGGAGRQKAVCLAGLLKREGPSYLDPELARFDEPGERLQAGIVRLDGNAGESHASGTSLRRQLGVASRDDGHEQTARAEGARRPRRLVTADAF